MSRKLELLAPAGSADIAVEAIRHGADAVYIGAPSHGARLSASNSLEDIRRVVDFAHIFNARVYVTVNTLVYDKEILSVERMIRSLYEIGTDALIVQDMGILRMDIPPIALHASTQCDIRTPEKALFLQNAGFSQLVLARELSIGEIRSICDAVTVPVEVFVHGALCVSYSGRCSMGYACSGRSGNRGECPQICRQAFTLRDADGKIIAKDKYLLSMKDLRADHLLSELIECGVSSFKIEGRLKEKGYVKNVVGAYSESLNSIVAKSCGKYCRASAGVSKLFFRPDLKKSFNRGFTSYRMEGSSFKSSLASIHTPKSQGEDIRDVNSLRPGDGISFFDANGNYTGIQVNGIKNGRIIGNRPFSLPKNAEIRRTSSIEWKKKMASDTARRTLSLKIEFSNRRVSAEDETGAKVYLAHTASAQPAQKPQDYKALFSKLGNTPFQITEFINHSTDAFYPASYITSLRRELIALLLKAKRAIYRFDYRREENISFPYPQSQLDYRDNVANRLARTFYADHRVDRIEKALELSSPGRPPGRAIVMSSKYCILRELGMCLRKKQQKIKMPLSLESGRLRFTPQFDCSNCEMSLSLQ